MQALKRTAQRYALQVAMHNGTNVRCHWHFQRAHVRGTLEVTWHERGQCFIVSVHRNREGANAWARDQAAPFSQALAREVKGRVVGPRERG